MKCGEWKAALAELATIHYRATGEIIPQTATAETKAAVRRTIASDNILADLYLGGAEIEDIAAVFELSADTVRSRIKKYGVCLRPAPLPVCEGERDSEMVRMYRSGMKQAEIAAAMGCSVSTVSAHLRRSGVKTRCAGNYPRSEKQLVVLARRRAALAAKTAERVKDGYKSHKHHGYVQVYAPDHPRGKGRGYVGEHILVMEKLIGRHLKSNEVVHHINHVRDDNRPENLVLMDRSEHQRMHMNERMKKEGGETYVIQP